MINLIQNFLDTRVNHLTFSGSSHRLEHLVTPKRNPMRFSPLHSRLSDSSYLDDIFFRQLKTGIPESVLSTWSPLNRMAFSSTYKIEFHPVVDGWVTGTLRSGDSFATPLHPNDLGNTDDVIAALEGSKLVGPFKQEEIAELEKNLSLRSCFFRADSDYVLNCDAIMQALGSAFSRWRRYIRVAERTKLSRVSIADLNTRQLGDLLSLWDSGHGVSIDRKFDRKEMEESFSLRNETSNIDGFGYFLDDRIVGATICDLSVDKVVNLLFMKTSKTVPFLSRLAIRDVASQFGKHAILNMGQDLDIAGLRMFKSSLPTSQVVDKYYLYR